MRIGIFIIIGAFFFLVLMFLSNNFLQVIFARESLILIDAENVRGSAVLKRNTLYTLGFDQQNRILGMLNKMEGIEKPKNLDEGKDLPFDKLIIYHFDTPKSSLKGKTLPDGRVVYILKTGSNTRYLLDNSGGKLFMVLKQAYQP